MLNEIGSDKSMTVDINTIFDIDEDSDMDISDHEIDDALNMIMNATDGIGETWEMKNDDETPQNSQSIERSKTFYLSVNTYQEWITNLEKAGLSYLRHERKVLGAGSTRKKNVWTEQWYCHHHGTYTSAAGKDPAKKPRLTQKESKKCRCKSYIQVVLPIDSNTVTLKYYYKHNNHQPGQLSDLCTLPLSDNIRQFIKQ
ncbi:24904_t:CDS:1, partial [Cetraspora pellucida]